MEMLASKQISLFDDQTYDRGYLAKLRRSMLSCIDTSKERQIDRAAKGKTTVEVDITLDQATALLVQQDFRCALTRLMFYCTKGSFGPSRPSFDRLHHDGPYRLGNIRIVMLGVNSPRGAGDDDDMYLLGAALMANQPRGR